MSPKKVTKDSIVGWTIMMGPGMKFFGEYKRGRWQDDNELRDLPIEERKGWGFKFDIMFGWTIRPIPVFWRWGFFSQKPKIKDIKAEDWDSYFGKKLADKMRKLDPSRHKFAAYNPWYAKYFFVLRLPKWIPTLFFSINTPWKSIYIGNKAYRIDPFENDITWTNKKDEERTKKYEPHSLYYALAPSASIRSGRS